MPSGHELETCSYIVLTDGEVEWDPENVMMDRNMLYRYKSCVAEMSRKQSKGGPSEIFHKSNLILVSITNSLVEDTALELLIPSINVKEAAPSLIKHGKAKAKMEHKKVTVRKVVENLRHSMVTAEHLAWTLNNGLGKAKQMRRVTTQRVRCTEVHPIRRRYRTDHLYLHLKYISGRWYVDWMPSATKSITQCKDEFVY